MTKLLKVAVLCSRRAPGLIQLLDTDPRRHVSYEIVCCVTSSDECEEAVALAERHVPLLKHSIRAFCAARGVRLRDLRARVPYDEQTARLLEPFEPDILLLDGYLLMLTAPMLRACAGRILNVHHADLLAVDGGGHPKFPGLRAVRDAFAGGERETRASAHIVTEGIDEGPVVLRSWPFPVPPIAEWARQRGDDDVLQSAARAHERWMLREAWPPMLTRTIELAERGYRRPGQPLHVASMGRHVLEPDGTLADERVLAEAL